jgi:hypothetical protein
MEAVTRKLREYQPPQVVIDPVMIASSGSPLMESDAAAIFIREILPLADVLTPNIPEAEAITGMPIRSIPDMECVAKKIMQMGAKTVLVKGGHSQVTRWTFCMMVQVFIISASSVFTPKTSMALAAPFLPPSRQTLHWGILCRRPSNGRKHISPLQSGISSPSGRATARPTIFMISIKTDYRKE